MGVPNCPVPNCPGAKLSWCQIVRFYYLGAKLSPLLSCCQIVRCQIVRCQIVLVPNCPGAKLSTFIILVPNCPLYYLGAKLSGAKLSSAKLSYNQNQVPYFSFQTYTFPK